MNRRDERREPTEQAAAFERGLADAMGDHRVVDIGGDDEGLGRVG